MALRYFNAAGPDPSGVVGERHEPETHLIPLALRGAGDPDYCLSIFGDDFDARGGSAIQGYIHVSDLADAHLKALEYLSKDGATTAINLGTGGGTSVLEIWHSAPRITSKSVQRLNSRRRPDDLAALAASTVNVEDVLGCMMQSSCVDNNFIA